MAAEVLKITTVLMLVMVVMHVQYATSDQISQHCENVCNEKCQTRGHLDLDCYFQCAEECQSDYYGNSFTLTAGISSSSASLLVYIHNIFLNLYSYFFILHIHNL